MVAPAPWLEMRSGRKGFPGRPAPCNLPVPPYPFVKGETIRIGENPVGQKFESDGRDNENILLEQQRSELTLSRASRVPEATSREMNMLKKLIAAVVLTSAVALAPVAASAANTKSPKS